MKGVFGLLLIAGGIVLVYGLFTGKITFPTGGTPPFDTTKIPAGTPGVNGQPGVPPVSLPAQGTACPTGYIYSPVTKDCQSLAGI